MAKILLVEDNEMIRDLASRRLKRRGFEVVIATDGAAGVEKAKSERPHLVLMDMGLPVIDGYEATRLLRASDETRGLPIIGLSAHAMSGDAQRALDAGCDDYDTKPIEWPRLLDKIQVLLDRRQAESPDAAEDAADAEVTGGTELSSALASCHVLVCDDSGINRDILSRRLAALGHTADVVDSGAAALARLAAGGVDALLLDVAPGDMEGEEVLRQVREDEAFAHLPVLMLCPVDAADRAIACLARGADDFLPQPFRGELLAARLAAGLELHRLRRRVHKARGDLAEERKRGDHLLRVLLPEPVVEELTSTRRILPRRHADVALLACDVVGFDALAEREDPARVIAALQDLIAAFEDLAARHSLEKVKSHRDLLLAAGGLFRREGDPAIGAVRCALDLLAASRDLAAGWTLRCGIHIGPVISGVVGKRRYQFDLWGRALRTVERVKDAGYDGTLHVTATAWQTLGDRVSGQEVPTPAGPVYRVDGLAGSSPG